MAVNILSGTQFISCVRDLCADYRAAYGMLGHCLSRLRYIVFLFKDKSDEQLMEAYRDGDLKAFDMLYNRFKNNLFRYLYRQLGNEAVAEEIFQDSWAALIKHRKTYTVKSKFKTYLFHIAHNKLIDYYRSKHHSRQDMISYDDNDEALSDQAGHDDRVVEKDISDDIDTLLKHEQLMRCIGKLPREQRDAFLLHEESGMTLIEIAKVMNVSRDTVKSRLRYALQKLRFDMERLHE